MHSQEAVGQRNTKCMCCLQKNICAALNGRVVGIVLAYHLSDALPAEEDLCPGGEGPRYLEKKVNRLTTLYLKQLLRTILYIIFQSTKYLLVPFVVWNGTNTNVLRSQCAWY